MTEEAAQPSFAVQAGPYKFLDHFADNEQDRRRFAGRDLEIRELVALITNGAVLVLYGRSGTGKTSLILAGVFPRLRERGYTPVYVRTLVDPLRDLCEAMVRQCGLGEGDPGCDVRAVAARAAESGSVAVVIDQFEEFFIRFRDKPELRAEFISAIAGIVNDQDLDVTIVFSLREEYLAALDEMAEKLPNLFENRYRLRALSAFGVRQAISRPLLDSGIPYEESVVSKLVDQLDAFGFDPAVVQIICSELYKEAARRAGDQVPRITEEDLERVGGLDGIFKRYLDGATLGIPQRLQLLARIVLDALITRESTKRAATVDDLLQSRFTASREDVEEVLTLLTEQCLLRRQVRDEVWYELMHERLIEYIEDWLNLDPDFLTFRQARIFVRNNFAGELWRGKPETLLNSEVLDGLLAPYRDRFRFDAGEVEYVLRSAVYRCSPSVTFWAERHGNEGAVALLQELAASSRPAERTGAATSAGRVPDPDGRLAELCLGLVLADPEPQVRRAAGLALAGRARAQELEALARALGEKSTRKNAREALAFLREGGHRLKGFGVLSRWRAGRQAERRILREKRDAIQGRAKSGAKGGAIGGLLWAVSAGALLAVMDSAARQATPLAPDKWVEGVIMSVVWFTALGALFGALLGWMSARAAAKDAAVRGEGHWFRAMLRIEVFFWFALALGSGCVVYDQTWSSLASAGAYLAAGLLVPVALGALAALNRPSVWPGLSLRSTLAWSLLSSLGLPVFLLLALSTLFSSLDDVDGSTFLSYLAILVSYFTCVIALAVARTAPGPPPVSPPRARRWSRAVTVLSAILIPVGFVFFYGLDTIPLLARDHDLSRPLVWQPGPVFPDASYIRLRNPDDRIQLWQVSSLRGPAELQGIEAYDPSMYNQPLNLIEGRSFSLPPGERFIRFFLQAPGAETTVHFRRLPLAPPAAPDPILLSWGGKKTFLLALSPVPRQPGTWRASLRGRMAGRIPPESERPSLTVGFWAAGPVKIGRSDAPARPTRDPWALLGNEIDLQPQFGPLLFSTLKDPIGVKGDGSWSCDFIVHADPEPGSGKPPLIQVEITAGT